MPKREGKHDVGSSNQANQGPTPPLITRPPPPFESKIADLSNPSSTPHSFSFGRNGMNNLISQIPDQHVLNIQ